MHNAGMHVSAKVDYGMRALLALAARYADDPLGMVKGDAIASGQNLPVKFVEGILGTLRSAGIVTSQRGAEGGYRLARPPEHVTVADVIRVLDGPLADVRGEAPEELAYTGPAEHLAQVWVATRAAMRAVVEQVTLRDVVEGQLPEGVARHLATPGAWERRGSTTPH